MVIIRKVAPIISAPFTERGRISYNSEAIESVMFKNNNTIEVWLQSGESKTITV